MATTVKYVYGPVSCCCLCYMTVLQFMAYHILVLGYGVLYDCEIRSLESVKIAQATAALTELKPI